MKIDINNINIHKSSDIFSISIILWQMLNGYNKYPFKNPNKNDELYINIINNNFDQFWLNHNDCKIITDNINNRSKLLSIKDLFNKMFEYNPNKRILIKDILSHEWLLQQNDITPNMFNTLITNEYLKAKTYINKKEKYIIENKSELTYLDSTKHLYSLNSEQQQNINNICFIDISTNPWDCKLIWR